MTFICRDRDARCWVAARAALGLLAGLWLLAACAGRFAAAPSTALEGRPDPFFTGLFTRTGPGWTGGDGTLSIALPDGRTLWLFGDSFLGTVRPDGSRPAESPLIRNCLVVQDGARLDTLHGGSLRRPAAFLVPHDPGTWYWPADGTVTDQGVQIFFHRYRQVSPGIWGWVRDGTVIALLRLPDLTVARVSEVTGHRGVAYGAALLETDSWVYVFGTEKRGAVNHLHVARAPRQDLEAPWQFWAGGGWKRDATASRPVLAGVGSQFGVVPLGVGLGLVTLDGRRPFSSRIVLYTAQSPTGPWEGPSTVYRVPEADVDVAAYNAFVHPQFLRPAGQLISYNLNHVRDPDALYADAALYRPRFIRANLECMAARVAGRQAKARPCR